MAWRLVRTRAGDGVAVVTCVAVSASWMPGWRRWRSRMAM